MPSELLHKETFLWRRASPTSFWIQMSTAAVLVKSHGERHFSDVHGGDFFLLSQVHFGSSLYTTVYLESSSALPFLWCLRRRLKTAQQFLQPHGKWGTMVLLPSSSLSLTELDQVQPSQSKGR